LQIFNDATPRENRRQTSIRTGNEIAGSSLWSRSAAWTSNIFYVLFDFRRLAGCQGLIVGQLFPHLNAFCGIFLVAGNELNIRTACQVARQHRYAHPECWPPD
jgi:hypothetical protein